MTDLTVRRFAEAEAADVVGLGAARSVAHDEGAAVSAAVALVLALHLLLRLPLLFLLLL